MKPSQRISQMNLEGSDGWEVFLRARGLSDAGHKITELTIGEHDIRTDLSILKAIHASAIAGNTGYSMVPGINTLRKAVAQRITRRTGVPTEIENVMITTGGQAALYAAHTATCDPGDTALYVEPYYATYPSTLRAQNLNAISIPTHAEHGFEPLKKNLEPLMLGARSLLINSPNNPSGTVYSRQTTEMISDLCKKYDLWLISDEVYDTQVWDGMHFSPRALPGMAERSLVIGSMSKSHAMTGSRVGWIVGPKDMISKLTDLATNITYGVPGYIQEGALFALSLGSSFEEQIGAPFRRRRQIALDILKEFPAVRAIDPKGAMYLMVDIRATGLSGDAFANRLLDERQIAVMPGESFGASAAGHLRIAMTIDDDRFASALETLCEFATQLAFERTHG